MTHETPADRAMRFEEGYSFCVNAELELGRAQFLVMTDRVKFTGHEHLMRLETKRILANVTEPCFAELGAILVRGRNIMAGSRIDALAFGLPLNHEDPLPEMTPELLVELPSLKDGDALSILGWYTGKVPDKLSAGMKYTLCFTLQGPARRVS